MGFEGSRACLKGPEVRQGLPPPLPVADGLQHRPGGGRGVGKDSHGGGRGPVEQVCGAAGCILRWRRNQEERCHENRVMRWPLE